MVVSKRQEEKVLERGAKEKSVDPEWEPQVKQTLPLPDH